MEKNKCEEGLDILAFIKYLFTKWKSIVIIAVIGLLLGAGYGFISAQDTQAGSSELSATEKELREYEAAKRTYEASEKRVEAVETYVLESAFMEINPYDLHKGTVSYAVESQQKNLQALNTALYSFVADGALVSDLEEVGPYTAVDLGALLQIEQDPDTFVVVSPDGMGKTTLRISIMAKTADEATELMEIIEISVQEYLDQLKSAGQLTGYEQLSSNVKSVVSNSVAEQQSYYREKYSAERSNNSTYKTTLEEKTPAKTEVVLSDGIDKGQLMKYSGAGLIAGIVIAIVLWTLVCIMNDRLYAVTDKEKRFGVKELAKVYNYEKMRGLDLMLGHLFGGVYSRLPVVEQREIALSNIKRELSENENIKKIVLASSLNYEEEELLIFKQALEAAGYEVVVGNGIVGNANLLQSVALCDCAIIIENNHASKSKLVKEEIMILKQYVKNVLGMVVVQKKC